MKAIILIGLEMAEGLTTSRMALTRWRTSSLGQDARRGATGERTCSFRQGAGRWLCDSGYWLCSQPLPNRPLQADGPLGWPSRPGRGRMARNGPGGPALFTWPAAERRVVRPKREGWHTHYVRTSTSATRCRPS